MTNKGELMKNNQFKIPENAQVHENFRTWKLGKKWLYASSILALLVSGGAIASSSQSVFADQVLSPSTGKTTGAENTATGRLESMLTAEANNATVTSSANDTKSAAQSAATVASSASDTKSAAQSAATAASSASDTKSAGSSAATVASSSSTTKADPTSANNSSAVKAETTSESSSSEVKADSTSANNSSAVNAETTSASSSEMKADSTSTNSSSAVKADVTSADGKQRVAQIATNDSKNSAIVTTKFDQNYGRKVLAGSVTNTGFSVSDPDYPSGMWIDPDKSHYSYEWLQAEKKGKNGGNQIVFSTNRTGDGIVYVTELSESNKVLKQYTLNQNDQVTSDVFDRTIYYNDVYFEMVRSFSNSFVIKYTASKFDNNYYNTLSYFVPKLITQTTYYVDKDGKEIIDSNGNPVATYTQKGLVGQNYTTGDVNVVNGYYAIAPANSNGVMSPYGKIGASYVKDFHNGVVITYTQTGSDGTMSASIAQNGSVLKTWTSKKPSDPTIMHPIGDKTYGIKNPYIPQTSDIKYVYNKLGNWVVYNPDGSTTSRIYPNDPSNATKIADSSVPDYPVIAFIPGYIAKDHMGTPLVPVDPDDRTKGYIPPTPSDNGTDTTITYTADQQKGSVSYVDDTTGKTLKTDSISGTTGSKSSYSTSGSIADYKKQGYELVTDGYPADLTFDNDDTTDQNFTVHLKHRLTPVNPTDPQTPGAPINPDEPDGPKWPEGTDKSSVTQTVIRTVNYLDKQTGKVVAKQVTEQVTYNRTAIVDKVTGQIIGYSTTGGDTVDQTDGNKAWTAVDNKSDWDSVTSPDLSSKGYLAPDLAKVAQQTVTPGDKDVTVNVYYDHDVVPVNPTNPQTPGTPINPDDPDSPKWPAGTDKNSLTTDVHQTIHYQYGDGSQAAPDKTDSTTFDHQVEIDKVTGEIVKDDGWKAENGKTSFDSKNSPVIPGYTASKPASDSVDGLTQDSKDDVQTIVYAKTPVAGGNVTAKYVDENGNPIADDVIASGNVGDPYSTTQKDVPGYTFKEVQGNPTGSFTDQDQTVTYVYTKNPSTDNNGGTGPNQPEKPDNGTDTGNPSSNQPGNPSQPSNATNNGVINTLTNTGSKVNNGAVNSPELPQTGENNRQSQTMSFIGVSLAMFGSLLGFLGIKKRRND